MAAIAWTGAGILFVLAVIYACALVFEARALRARLKREQETAEAERVMAEYYKQHSHAKRH